MDAGHYLAMIGVGLTVVSYMVVASWKLSQGMNGIRLEQERTRTEIAQLEGRLASRIRDAVVDHEDKRHNPPHASQR